MQQNVHIKKSQNSHATLHLIVFLGLLSLMQSCQSRFSEHRNSNNTDSSPTLAKVVKQVPIDLSFLEKDFSNTVPTINNSRRTYIAPNEQMPKDSVPLLSNVPRGAYLSVGSERGFIGAALAQATEVILLDYEAEVVFFNRLNTLLFSLSKNQDDYRKLRLSESATVWRRRLENLPAFKNKGENKNEKDVSYLVSDEAFAWWDSCVRQAQSPGCLHFNWFHKSLDEWGELKKKWKEDFPESQAPDRIPYENTNYLLPTPEGQQLFSHLKALADQGLIQSFPFDFKNDDGLTKLLKSLTDSGKLLSVFDFSNTWSEDFVGKQQTADIMTRLTPLMSHESVFLMTVYDSKKQRYLPFRSQTTQKQAQLNAFIYIAFLANMGHSFETKEDIQRCYQNIISELPERWNDYSYYASKIAAEGEYFQSKCGVKANP